jgi:hypothetical protein
MAEVMNVIGNDLLLRVWIGVIANVAGVEIRIGALYETDVRAVVLRIAFGEEIPAPVPSGDAVFSRIGEAITGAIPVDAVVGIEEEVARRRTEDLKSWLSFACPA